MEKIAIEYWRGFWTATPIFWFVGILTAALLIWIGNKLERRADKRLAKVKLPDDAPSSRIEWSKNKTKREWNESVKRGDIAY